MKKKERLTHAATWMNLTDPLGGAQGADTKGSILYDSTQRRLRNRQDKSRVIEVRMVAIRGEGE